MLWSSSHHETGGLARSHWGAVALRHKRASQDLVDECEAFLTGRFAELIEAGEEEVPLWAWTNLLAHGSEGMLRRERAFRGSSPTTSEWRRARSYLATEVLNALSDCGSLESLQRELLVPYEGELASSAKAVAVQVHDWVTTLEGRLERHRRMCRHSGSQGPSRCCS